MQFTPEARKATRRLEKQREGLPPLPLLLLSPTTNPAAAGNRPKRGGKARKRSRSKEFREVGSGEQCRGNLLVRPAIPTTLLPNNPPPQPHYNLTIPLPSKSSSSFNPQRLIYESLVANSVTKTNPANANANRKNRPLDLLISLHQDAN